MQFKLFSIPATGDAWAEEELLNCEIEHVPMLVGQTLVPETRRA